MYPDPFRPSELGTCAPTDIVAITGDGPTIRVAIEADNIPDDAIPIMGVLLQLVLLMQVVLFQRGLLSMALTRAGPFMAPA